MIHRITNLFHIEQFFRYGEESSVLRSKIRDELAEELSSNGFGHSPKTISTWNKKKQIGVDIMAKKGGLGRGLDALLMENTLETSDVASTLPIYEIENNKSQPRTDFDDEALNELAESIRQHGVLQPILVRPIANGRYQIVAGERRWRASRLANLSEVPVIIRDLDDTQVMLLAMIENLQREQLNPVEEAEGYKKLKEETLSMLGGIRNYSHLQ